MLFLVVYSSGSHCGESYASEFLCGLKEFCIKFSTLLVNSKLLTSQKDQNGDKTEEQYDCSFHHPDLILPLSVSRSKVYSLLYIP